ncbi:MAG TPA: nicotinate (nicotinamide) nucleotide adenylyltransferase [Paludibacteraceae bacterium]|nr:nicotinate (nicotinamide) nucleotide adenylyltransferase [Paludibacteraceae bacterium]
MRIGLYFGSFNPIHNGHIGLSNYLLTSDLEEVWLIVSPHNPLKESAHLLDDKLRFEMARLAVKNNPKIQVSEVEFGLPKPSYTINTLNYLSIHYPQHEFVLLIGADNVETFDKWRDYEGILNRFKVLVYPREGFPKFSDKFPQMRFIDAPLFHVSSTEIRERLQRGEDCSNLMPAEVIHFINTHRLYQ